MNILIITGRLGGDADLRYTKSGTAVCNFSVPAEHGYGDNKGVTWVRCNLWGKRAEALSQYLTKGTPVTVSGEASLREWQDKDGAKNTSLEMNVSDVTLQGGKKQEAQKQEASEPPADDFKSDDIPF